MGYHVRRMSRIVPMVFLLMLFVSTGVLLAQAEKSEPDPASVELAHDLLVAMKADSVIVQTMMQKFPEQRAANPDLPDEFWIRMMESASTNISSLIDRMAPVYAENFSQDDLRQLVAFYRSPTGERYASRSTQLTSAMMKQAELWGMEIAADVIKDMAAEGVRFE